VNGFAAAMSTESLPAGRDTARCPASRDTRILATLSGCDSRWLLQNHNSLFLHDRAVPSYRSRSAGRASGRTVRNSRLSDAVLVDQRRTPPPRGLSARCNTEVRRLPASGDGRPVRGRPLRVWTFKQSLRVSGAGVGTSDYAQSRDAPDIRDRGDLPGRDGCASIPQQPCAGCPPGSPYKSARTTLFPGCPSLPAAPLLAVAVGRPAIAVTPTLCRAAPVPPADGVSHVHSRRGRVFCPSACRCARECDHISARNRSTSALSPWGGDRLADYQPDPRSVSAPRCSSVTNRP